MHCVCNYIPCLTYHRISSIITTTSPRLILLIFLMYTDQGIRLCCQLHVAILSIISIQLDFDCFLVWLVITPWLQSLG
jgi:hypothetical protein